MGEERGETTPQAIRTPTFESFAHGLTSHENEYGSKLTERTQYRSANLILPLKHFALRADYTIALGFLLGALLLLLGAVGMSATV